LTPVLYPVYLRHSPQRDPPGTAERSRVTCSYSYSYSYSTSSSFFFPLSLKKTEPLLIFRQMSDKLAQGEIFRVRARTAGCPSTPLRKTPDPLRKTPDPLRKTPDLLRKISGHLLVLVLVLGIFLFLLSSFSSPDSYHFDIIRSD